MIFLFHISIEISYTFPVKRIKTFLSFIELQTKTASAVPFFVGSGYALYRYGSLQVKQTLIFFAAMLLFDMTTTAANNHIGCRQTARAPHYSTAVSLAIIFAMGIAAAALGLYLVSISGIVILPVGIFCFAAGIAYSYGPLPIAHTPFGEIVSGLVMGICIPFIALQINHPAIALVANGFEPLLIIADWIEILALGVAAAPLVCCIANIMLANNICDIEEDIRVKRYTLPFYIGIKKSVLLYRILFAAVHVFIIAAIIFRIAPIFSLVLLLTIIPVWKNVLRFKPEQGKEQSIIGTVKNFLIINVPYAACMWLGGVLNF